MSKYKAVKLRDIVIINPSSINKGYPFNTIEYLDISSVGSNICAGTTTYTIELAPSRARRLVKDGDTIISTVRPNLKVYLKIKRPVDNLVVSTGFAVLRPSKLIDPDYLFYSISNQNYIDYLSAIADSKTTSYPAVDTDDIRNSKIALPPFEVQQKIGTILSFYDELIKNNSRRIAILEEMALCLYREWLVHYRFPGHEKSSMVESKIGLIPAGWITLPFSDAVEINPKYKKPTITTHNFVDMAGLSSNVSSIQIKEQRSSFTGSKFSNGDTLIARITPCLENGKTGFVQCLNKKEIGIGSTEFVVLQSKKLTPELVYLMARQDEFRGLLIKSMTGASGRQRANAKVLERYIIPVPPQCILEAFSKFVQPCFSQIKCLSNKNLNLSKTRDLLLPRLISGDIDVSELDIEIKRSVEDE